MDAALYERKLTMLRDKLGETTAEVKAHNGMIVAAVGDAERVVLNARELVHPSWLDDAVSRIKALVDEATPASTRQRSAPAQQPAAAPPSNGE